MARRTRLFPGFLPQQKTTFTAKTPLSLVGGPFRVAKMQVYTAGIARAEVYAPGIKKGQVA